MMKVVALVECRCMEHMENLKNVIARSEAVARRKLKQTRRDSLLIRSEQTPQVSNCRFGIADCGMKNQSVKSEIQIPDLGLLRKRPSQ